jgi:hypothetical protein
VVRNGVISWVLDEYYPGYERDLKQKVDEALAQRKRGDRQTALLDN